jgi:hypothetical protein
VRPELDSLRDYDSWRNTFIRLGETAAAQGRIQHAALHFRAGEFFMQRPILARSRCASG